MTEKKNTNQSLSPTTLKKEMGSFRAVWNWGMHMGLVSCPFPNRGLQYPKGNEKPQFQTWNEIERQIIRGMPLEQEAELWDSLFLTTGEIDALLKHVRTMARHPFIYPMFCFAAHTGARRSEMIRLSVNDLDLDSGFARIHEKKRCRQRTTHRRVPLSLFLVNVLKDWLHVHPGGRSAFCLDLQVGQSSKRRCDFVPLTN